MMTDTEHKGEPKEWCDVPKTTEKSKSEPTFTSLQSLCNKPGYSAEFDILRIQYLAR